MIADPFDRLSTAFQGMERQAIADLGKAIGATPRIAFYAAQARPISADHYLKFCAKLGLDPVTGKPRKPCEVGDLQWPLIGAGLKMRRQLEHKGQRPAAEAYKLSYSTLRRAESGEPVTVTSLLKICAGLGVHPFGYCRTFGGVAVVASAWLLPAAGCASGCHT